MLMPELSHQKDVFGIVRIFYFDQLITFPQVDGGQSGLADVLEVL